MTSDKECKGCSGSGESAKERLEIGDCYFHKDGKCLFGEAKTR